MGLCVCGSLCLWWWIFVSMVDLCIHACMDGWMDVWIHVSSPQQSCWDVRKHCSCGFSLFSSPSSGDLPRPKFPEEYIELGETLFSPTASIYRRMKGTCFVFSRVFEPWSKSGICCGNVFLHLPFAAGVVCGPSIIHQHICSIIHTRCPYPRPTF